MTPLSQEFKTITIHPPQHFRNLTLFPLSRPHPGAGPDYVLADEAIQKGLARVTEVEGGTVPELRFENGCHTPVLLLDGEELIGAKQNRVVNLTILVPALSTIVIPVSCVEAGRWHMATDAFQPAPHMMYSRARASRTRQVTDSLRVSGSRRSDQSAVWDDIAAKAVRMEAASPTGAISAIFERHAISVEEYVRALECPRGACGVIFACAGVFGMDLFDRPETLAQLFPKLVRSYALDALDSEKVPAVPPVSAALGFLKHAGAAPSVTEPAVGLGKDIRFTGTSAAGAALWAEGCYIHVCAFSDSNPRTSGLHTRVVRPSRRRTRGTAGPEIVF
jgi:hypothetical protein